MPLERDVAVPDANDLRIALDVVRRHLPATPLVPAATLGDDVWLKLETMQPVGAFKVRGALAALARRGGPRRVVTASAGNHALGVAWAARRLAVDAQVMVPETASPAKLAALRAAGADLVVHGVDVDAAEALALAVAADGAEFVSAYNDTDVIAGNATIGAELDAACAGDLCVVVPIGGGGLLAGVALWARQRGNVRVVGVEAEASRQMSAAFAAGGRRVLVDVHPTVADGLAGNLEAGAITAGIAVAVAVVDEIVAVSEPELRGAMRELALGCGVVAEGAGAATTAAILAGRIRRRPGETVVALVTGRNCTPELLREVLDV